MTAIHQIAYPRAGLLGNPSDGYFGKTISFTFRDFEASVWLEESDRLCFLPNHSADRLEFENLHDFDQSICSRGYYGGLRILKAAVKRFANYCTEQGHKLPSRNFTIRYESNIPRQVGLAGSSALVTAAIEGLCKFYEIKIPREKLPNLILEVETKELGIPAGLQDRVVQVYGGLVMMDFDKELVNSRGYGDYVELDANLLSGLYIAWDENCQEGTEVTHSGVRKRWNSGDRLVIETIQEIANLVDEGRKAIEAKDMKKLGELIDRNFDLRARIFNISTGQKTMVEAARNAGASAKFAGSGGAIVGLVDDSEQFERLSIAMHEIGASIIQPIR